MDSLEDKLMIYVENKNTSVAPNTAVVMTQPVVRPTRLTTRLAIRGDEAARRKIADTDGTQRRARQLAESNRLL